MPHKFLTFKHINTALNAGPFLETLAPLRKKNKITFKTSKYKMITYFCSLNDINN